jgi:hypothetical protein
MEPSDAEYVTVVAHVIEGLTKDHPVGSITKSELAESPVTTVDVTVIGVLLVPVVPIVAEERAVGVMVAACAVETKPSVTRAATSKPAQKDLNDLKNMTTK